MTPRKITGSMRRGAILAGGAALLALGVACTPTTEVTVAPGEGAAAQGIAVSGEGSVSVRPDVAIVDLGVEVNAATVAEARAQAADAMTAIQDALSAQGVEEADIRTQYFNIYPQYSYPENGAPQITGFIVSNIVKVHVRNLDSVSDVLDDSIEAGGDVVRVNGMTFTVEDPEQHLGDARRAAIADARAHAEVLADAAGVELGAPVSINEITSSTPEYYPGPERAATDAGGASTPVSPGEQELKINVSVVFAISEQ